MLMRTIRDRYRSLDERNPYFRTGLITLFMLFFAALDINVKPGPDSEFVQEGALGLVLALFQVLPVIFARKYPLPMLAIIFAAFIAHTTLGHQVLWVAQFSSMFVLFLATSQGTDRRSLLAGGMTFAVIIIVFAIVRRDVDSAIALVILFGAIWIAGNVVDPASGG